ncbi:MAG: hypothetical protein WCK29_00385 [archaeon]
MKMNNKKAAIELSTSTIVIIVLAVTMLILGMVLVRSVLCSAIGLSSDVTSKAQSELNTYFGDSGNEVSCIGSQGDAVKLVAGKPNNIYCLINAPVTAKYETRIVGITSSIPSLTKEMIQKWMITSTFTSQIGPGNKDVQKIIRLIIPSDAPEATIIFDVEVYKDGQFLVTQHLDFAISRVGFVKNAIC